MLCDNSSHNIFRWVTRMQTKVSFAKLSIIYSIETIWGRFFIICFITWLIPATCEELDDNVCVLCNYVDNFLWALNLCIETHENQTFLTPAKHSSIMEKFLTSFGAKIIWCNIWGNQSLIFVNCMGLSRILTFKAICVPSCTAQSTLPVSWLHLLQAPFSMLIYCWWVQ